nr:hypothetical protein [Lactiplantibacillus plantarum]
MTVAGGSTGPYVISGARVPCNHYSPPLTSHLSSRSSCHQW